MEDGQTNGGGGLILKYFVMLLLFITGLGVQSTFAEGESMLKGFSVGIGGSIITNEYKDMNGDVTALPLLSYEGEYFYLRGVSGGFHFYRTDWLELNAQISYLPQHFYAGNSDNWAMQQLDNRYSTLMGGFNGRVLSEFGVLSATFETDLLGYNNGILVDANYMYPFELGLLRLAPAIGIQWTDANYNRYYYGIDHSEARESGLEYYDPESCFTPYVQLGGRLNFTENWSAIASVRAIFLNEQVYDSPMVDRSEKYAFSLGAMYSF